MQALDPNVEIACLTCAEKTLSYFYDDSEADVIQSVVLPLTKLKKIEKKIGRDEEFLSVFML